MKALKKILVMIPVFMCFLLINILLAAEETLSGKKGAAPIQIEADHMESDQKNNSVFFSGNVEAKQDDISIHADEVTVYYKKKGGQEKKSPTGKATKIKKLRAVGHVEITKEGWVAQGDSAEYFESERKVVLNGNTKVWQNNNLVTGDRFIMYLDEGKSIVERDSQKKERVKAFLYPGTGK